MGNREHIVVISCNTYEKYKMIIKDIIHLADLFGYTLLVSSNYNQSAFYYNIYVTCSNIEERKAVVNAVVKYYK